MIWKIESSSLTPLSRAIIAPIAHTQDVGNAIQVLDVLAQKDPDYADISLDAEIGVDELARRCLVGC